MEDLIIRGYRKGDRTAIRDIACDTAFMGEPADVFFDDREVLADFLTSYFTDYEPGSSFVAEAGGEVVGYLTGAKDARSLSRTYALAIAPRLLLKSIARGTVFRKKNFILLLSFARSYFKGEFKAPDFPPPQGNYPATLHVNIRKDFRGKNIGSGLIEHYLAYLAASNIRGVHVSTLSDRAAGFFESNGFTLLYRRDRSYFKHILGRTISCNVLARAAIPIVNLNS